MSIYGLWPEIKLYYYMYRGCWANIMLYAHVTGERRVFLNRARVAQRISCEPIPVVFHTLVYALKVKLRNVARVMPSSDHRVYNSCT